MMHGQKNIKLSVCFSFWKIFHVFAAVIASPEVFYPYETADG
jgi:hypothetical protein